MKELLLSFSLTWPANLQRSKLLLAMVETTLLKSAPSRELSILWNHVTELELEMEMRMMQREWELEVHWVLTGTQN